VHQKSQLRLKKKLRKLTSRKWSVSLEYRLKKLKQTIHGWVNYYKLADMKTFLKKIDQHIRLRIRMCIWKAWKTIRNKAKSLVRLGLSRQKAWEYANSRKGYMRVASSFILSTTLTNKRLKEYGLISMEEYFLSVK
jgi:RNA-directed DNA polymerase